MEDIHRYLKKMFEDMFQGYNQLTAQLPSYEDLPSLEDTPSYEDVCAYSVMLFKSLVSSTNAIVQNFLLYKKLLFKSYKCKPFLAYKSCGIEQMGPNERITIDSVRTYLCTISIIFISYIALLEFLFFVELLCHCMKVKFLSWWRERAFLRALAAGELDESSPSRCRHHNKAQRQKRRRRRRQERRRRGRARLSHRHH